MITLKADWFYSEMAIRNMTQDRFARDVLEINPSYFSQLLSGRREPGPKVRQRMMEALKAPFEHLFQIESSPQREAVAR